MGYIDDAIRREEDRLRQEGLIAQKAVDESAKRTAEFESQLPGYVRITMEFLKRVRSDIGDSVVAKLKDTPGEIMLEIEFNGRRDTMYLYCKPTRAGLKREYRNWAKIKSHSGWHAYYRRNAEQARRHTYPYFVLRTPVGGLVEIPLVASASEVSKRLLHDNAMAQGTGTLAPQQYADRLAATFVALLRIVANRSR